MSLLLLLVGATTGVTPPARPAVGWGGSIGRRRRYDPKDLERRLQEQSDATFNRRWFNELLEAQDALVAKAAKAKSEAQQRALEEAAEAAWQVAEEDEQALHTADEMEALVAACKAAANATRATAVIKNANLSVLLATQYGRMLDEDDDEAMMLLF